MPNHSVGLLLTLAASVLWGTTFVASQVGLRYTDPYSLAFLRFIVAAATIVALAPLIGKKLSLTTELRKKSRWLLGGIYALGFLLQYLGQSLTTASEATLLSNLAPILAPITAFIILDDFVATTQKTAIVLGFVGLFLVASPRLTTDLTSMSGDLMLLGTSVCYTLFIVFSKRMNIGSMGSSFVFIIVVSVFLAPIAVYFGGLNPFDLKIDLTGWASIVYLGVPCTLVALSLYLKGLSVITVSESAVLLLAQILMGLILAVLLLDERLSLSQWLGAVAIISALVLGVLRKDKKTVRQLSETAPGLTLIFHPSSNSQFLTRHRQTWVSACCEYLNSDFLNNQCSRVVIYARLGLGDCWSWPCRFSRRSVWH